VGYCGVDVVGYCGRQWDFVGYREIDVGCHGMQSMGEMARREIE